MKEEMPLRVSLRRLLESADTARGFFFDPPVLETERLRLRGIRMRDAKDIYEWSSDPEVAEYVLWEAHRSVGETRDYIRYIRGLYRRGLPSSWGVELKSEGKVIGTIGLMSYFPEHRSAEVGYSFGKAWWHHGYAPEALSALLDFLFEKMKLNRVEAQCDVRNGPSARVMEKSGMRREGLLRQRVINKGSPVDVYLYAVLREEWLKSAQS